MQIGLKVLKKVRSKRGKGVYYYAWVNRLSLAGTSSVAFAMSSPLGRQGHRGYPSSGRGI